MARAERHDAEVARVISRSQGVGDRIVRHCTGGAEGEVHAVAEGHSGPDERVALHLDR